MKIIQPLFSDEQRGSLWHLIYFSMRGANARASRMPQTWRRKPGATAPNPAVMKNALQQWRNDPALHAQPWQSYAPWALTTATSRSTTTFELRRATISTPQSADPRRLYTLNN